MSHDFLEKQKLLSLLSIFYPLFSSGVEDRVAIFFLVRLFVLFYRKYLPFSRQHYFILRLFTRLDFSLPNSCLDLKLPFFYFILQNSNKYV